MDPSGADAVGLSARVGTLSLAERMRAKGRLMWAFMLAHPFSPGNTAAWASSGIPGKLPDYCRVP